MSARDYRNTLRIVTQDRVAGKNLVKDLSDKIKAYEKRLKSLQQDIDFYKRELTKSLAAFEKTTDKLEAVATPLVARQDELEAAKKAKPVDKHKVKQIEAELKKDDKKIDTLHNQWMADKLSINDLNSGIATDFKKLD